MSSYAEDNWMVRFLTNEMSGAVYDRHLELAKQVLESKCVVGLLEEFSPSFKRFGQYFDWSATRAFSEVHLPGPYLGSARFVSLEWCLGCRPSASLADWPAVPSETLL